MLSNWTPQHTRVDGDLLVAWVTSFLDPIPHVRLKRVLDLFGWGPKEGPIRFERDNDVKAWHLGNGHVVKPWWEKRVRPVPTDPAQAIKEIEEYEDLPPWTGIWWETETGRGVCRSVFAGYAHADRQLRIEKKLPYYKTREITVRPCGHLDCTDLMGCFVEAAIANRRPTFENPLCAPPGSKLVIHQVGDIGRWQHDWIVGSPT